MFETLTQKEARSETDRYQGKLRDILEQAAELFARQGYHNTSMRDLSRELDTSLAGLYYYFETKEELLYLISKYSFDTVRQSIEARLTPGMPATEKLRLFVHNHLQYFVTHLSAMKVLAHESDSLTDRYFDDVNRKKRQYLNLLESILLELRRETRGSAAIDGTIKVAALSLFGMMNWTHTWYNPRKTDNRVTNITTIADTMVSIFLQGFHNTQPATK
jgi:AcrR family transcriptional regulator